MDDTARPTGQNSKADTGNLQSASGQSFDDESINLAEYLGVISKSRKMIFRVCCFAVIATGIVSIFLPKSFLATTSVVPPTDDLQQSMAMAGGLGAVKSPLLRQVMNVSNIADMYVGILQSRSVADAIIEKFDLEKVYKVNKDVSEARQILKKRTSVKVSEAGIVNIAVEDRDPCRAAALANAYVEELDRQNKRLFTGQATSKKIFLENRLKEIEKELSGIDNLLSRDAKIKEMLFELLTREYEIAKIEEAKNMPTIQVLDKAVVPEKKCKPKRARMMFIAGVAGLFISVLWAFAREYSGT